MEGENQSRAQLDFVHPERKNSNYLAKTGRSKGNTEAKKQRKKENAVRKEIGKEIRKEIRE